MISVCIQLQVYRKMLSAVLFVSQYSLTLVTCHGIEPAGCRVELKGVVFSHALIMLINTILGPIFQLSRRRIRL